MEIFQKRIRATRLHYIIQCKKIRLNVLGASQYSWSSILGVFSVKSYFLMTDISLIDRSCSLHQAGCTKVCGTSVFFLRTLVVRLLCMYDYEAKAFYKLLRIPEQWDCCWNTSWVKFSKHLSLVKKRKVWVLSFKMKSLGFGFKL